MSSVIVSAGSGVLNVNITGGAGQTVPVFSDPGLTTPVTLPVTVSGTTSVFYLTAPGYYRVRAYVGNTTYYDQAPYIGSGSVTVGPFVDSQAKNVEYVVNLASTSAQPSTSANPIDCSSQIQSILETGAQVFIPPSPYGAYFFTQVNLFCGSNILGAGCGGPGNIPTNGFRSILKRMPGATGPAFVGGSGVGQVVLKGFELDGNTQNGAVGVGISLSDVSVAEEAEWHIEDVYVHDTSDDCVYIGNGRRAVKMFFLKARNSSGTAGLHIAGSDTEAYASLIAGQTGATTNNIQIESTAGITRIIGGDVYGAQHGIYLNGGDGRYTIMGVGLDKHTGVGVYVAAGTKTVSITNNLFHSNSQSADGAYPHIYQRSTDNTIRIADNEFGDLDGGITNRVNYNVQCDTGCSFSDGGNMWKPAATSTGLHTNKAWITSGAKFGGLDSDINNALEPLPILQTANGSATLTAGTAFFTYGVAKDPITVGNIVTATRTTAAVGATAAYVGLYTVDDSGNLTQVAVSADVHTTAWIATNTTYVVPLTASYTLIPGQRYAIGLLIVGASTAPTLVGVSYGAATILNDGLTRSTSIGAQTVLSGSYAVGGLSTLGSIFYAKAR